jgi:tungstate transport system ATP-binding protein
VEIRDLVVHRAGRLVLAIDHLEIEKGKVLALVGPNGAGKSTLLLALARLLKPERGEILFAGQKLDQIQPYDYRRKIGLVMQESLLLDMSVAQNVAIGLKFRRLSQQEILSRVDEWLERLNIMHLKHRLAIKLSGGEAQRVALARVFVLQPELLLLDEPFGGLDKNTRSDLIRDLKFLLPAMDTTTIFSTHDEAEVAALAVAEIELNYGRIDNGKGHP